jgi:hypothetical protein
MRAPIFTTATGAEREVQVVFSKVLKNAAYGEMASSILQLVTNAFKQNVHGMSAGFLKTDLFAALVTYANFPKTQDSIYLLLGYRAEVLAAARNDEGFSTGD